LRVENPHEWVRDKSRWNYYMSANFPLTSLYLGHKIHIGDVAQFHRLFYALVDSMAAFLVFLTCWRFWPRNRSDHAVGPGATTDGEAERRYYSAMLLGPVCPVFLLWGTLYSEDKGMQTLLMVGALLCLLLARTKFVEVVGAILLGMSVAFKALGFFLAPIYLKVLKQRHGSVVPAIVALLIALAVVVASFAPFSTHFANVMVGRLHAGAGAGGGAHHSPWLAVHAILPVFYTDMLRYATVAVSLALLGWAYFRDRLDPFAFWGSTLFVFSVVFIASGGLDRMGIAVLVSICMIGVQNPTDGERLAVGQAAIFASIWVAKALNFPPEGFDLANATATLVFVIYFAFVLAGRLQANWRKGVASECPDPELHAKIAR
jgi:hypothetical protein